MIPEFDSNGNLPPGIHAATWEELEKRFARNWHRRNLFKSLKFVAMILRAAGCRRVYVDGSFVTSKKMPVDYDCCWEPAGVDEDSLPPALNRDIRNWRAKQHELYMGEIFCADWTAAEFGISFLDLFQLDRLTNTAKGIVVIDL